MLPVISGQTSSSTPQQAKGKTMRTGPGSQRALSCQSNRRIMPALYTAPSRPQDIPASRGSQYWLQCRPGSRAKGKTRPKSSTTSTMNQADRAERLVKSSMGRVSGVFISSKAKNMPATGAPKAAVMPATPPPTR